MGPIVSGYGSLTHTFLDLTDSEKLPSDLKDTDFFNELNQITYISTMDSLVTLDVTHISHEAGFYCNDSRVPSRYSAPYNISVNQEIFCI